MTILTTWNACINLEKSKNGWFGLHPHNIRCCHQVFFCELHPVSTYKVSMKDCRVSILPTLSYMQIYAKLLPLKHSLIKTDVYIDVLTMQDTSKTQKQTW